MTPEVSKPFLIVLFTVAIVVGAAIVYLGINGFIGGPIP